jgi:hypothetical protein
MSRPAPVKTVLSVMKLEKTCPGCNLFFSEKELLVTKPVPKENPRWFEASHKNAKLICPRCGCNLKIRKLSLWPLLLLIPASLGFFVLSQAYSSWLLAFVGLVSLALLKVTINFEKADR